MNVGPEKNRGFHRQQTLSFRLEVPGSRFLVPGSRFGFLVRRAVRNLNPEPGTWNLEPGTWLVPMF